MRNRFFIFACLLSASCSSLLPIADGHYEPIAVEATADRLPVRLRSVDLDHCHFDKMDGVGTSVPLTPAERETVRRGLQETLAGDIVRDGPLRTAAAGEEHLVVDVEVMRLASPVRSGSTIAMQVFQGLFLFVPTLIGVPIASLSELGDATFTVYDQDGLTELCQLRTKVRSSRWLSLYGQRHPAIGQLMAPMVAQFKGEVASRLPGLRQRVGDWR